MKYLVLVLMFVMVGCGENAPKVKPLDPQEYIQQHLDEAMLKFYQNAPNCSALGECLGTVGKLTALYRIDADAQSYLAKDGNRVYRYQNAATVVGFNCTLKNLKVAYRLDDLQIALQTCLLAKKGSK